MSFVRRSPSTAVAIAIPLSGCKWSTWAASTRPCMAVSIEGAAPPWPCRQKSNAATISSPRSSPGYTSTSARSRSRRSTASPACPGSSFSTSASVATGFRLPRWCSARIWPSLSSEPSVQPATITRRRAARSSAICFTTMSKTLMLGSARSSAKLRPCREPPWKTFLPPTPGASKTVKSMSSRGPRAALRFSGER